MTWQKATKREVWDAAQCDDHLPVLVKQCAETFGVDALAVKSARHKVYWKRGVESDEQVQHLRRSGL